MSLLNSDLLKEESRLCSSSFAGAESIILFLFREGYKHYICIENKENEHCNYLAL